MISAKALRDAFQQALSEEWGYIWGTRGQTWTQASQNKATRAMTVKYGSKWIGRRVADCSGLFVWAYKLHNESIYHGSNTIFNSPLISSLDSLALFALGNVNKVR